MNHARKEPKTLLTAFGIVSLAAVATGAVVCAASGVPTGLWIRNLAAWAVGALIALGPARTLGPRGLMVLLLAAPLGLAATFASPDLQDVHRWIDAGPLRMNVAMALLPAAAVALAALAPGRRWPWLVALACLALLAAQPDASQATAFAAVVAWIAGTTLRAAPVRLLLVLATGALAALAWMQPDWLLPVPEVEGIVGLAQAMSPALGVLAVALLLAVAATPVILARKAQPLAGQALGLCLLVTAIMPFLGAYPVPLVGVGLSPILGAWLGVGALAALLRDRA